jgi:hypothetical protein
MIKEPRMHSLQKDMEKFQEYLGEGAIQKTYGRLLS